MLKVLHKFVTSSQRISMTNWNIISMIKATLFICYLLFICDWFAFDCTLNNLNQMRMLLEHFLPASNTATFFLISIQRFLDDEKNDADK